MEGQAQVQALVNNGNGLQASGNVAMKLLQSGMDVSVLRTLDSLRKDEWKQYDQALVEVARDFLGGVTDLLSAGLRYDLPNAMGHTLIEWEKVSDMDGATVNMNPLSRGTNDKLDFTMDRLPVPITFKEFFLNARHLAASRNRGEPLDTTQARVASRKVLEKTEDMLFSGDTISAGGATIYGYKTYPNRNTGSLTAAFSVATGAQILTDLLAMIQALHDDHFYGPYVLYVPVDAYVHMVDDFKAASDKSIISRILEIPLIKAVRPSTRLTGGSGTGAEVLLMQQTSDVVEMVVGMEPTTVSWETQAGFMMHFMIMSIMFPRFKSDYDGRCGLAHYTKA